MFKSTLFIAVKCCQCSTMQVKQQKKSSNKWNCAVCNQKQSVMKIYAQGYQAKEIRSVVQSFNMSRKFEDELQQDVSSLGNFVEQLEGVQETGENKGKRRVDWSEYIEDDVNVEPAYLKSNLNEKGMGDEAKVVTEFYEDLMLKKPRVKGTSGSGLSSVSSGKIQSYRPSFSKRGSTREIVETQEVVCDDCIVEESGLNRDVISQCEQQQQIKILSKMKTGASDWSPYTAKDEFTRDIGGLSKLQQQQQQPNNRMSVMKTSVSRWSEYVTEDDDGVGDKEDKAAFADDLRLISEYKLENGGFDQLIEEDIHPDFM